MVRKKKAAEPQGNEELFLALGMLEKEKGIPMDFMLDKIKKAIGTACKNTYNNEDVDMKVDPGTGRFEVYLLKTVVEEIEDPDKELLLEEARRISPMAMVGGTVGIKLDTKQFGRVAAQTARNIIRQGIRDSERGQMMQEFQSKHQELVSALIERVDPRTGALTLRIGKAEAVLPKTEQIGGESVHEGDYIKVYVVDVLEGLKGPKAIISRTRPELVKRMVEEGHMVGNHTYHHPDMSAISSLDTFEKELDDVADSFYEITGTKLAPYYRPPQGKANAENIRMAQQLGYSTIFWSLAYVDWDTENQPSHDAAFDKLTSRIHPGAIVLLHNTSRTNGEILDELLTKWEEMGYHFAPLSQEFIPSA